MSGIKRQNLASQEAKRKGGRGRQRGRDGGRKRGGGGEEKGEEETGEGRDDD